MIMQSVMGTRKDFWKSFSWTGVFEIVAMASQYSINVQFMAAGQAEGTMLVAWSWKVTDGWGLLGCGT